MRHILAITSGDPAGIGPEITAKALMHREVYGRCVPVVIGDEAPLRAAVALAGADLKLNLIESPSEALGQHGTVDLLDIHALSGGLEPKRPSAVSGEAAYRYIDKGIALALAGEVRAVVTGPISKEALHMAGHMYSGHTELFADKTGIKSFAMLLTSGSLRVIHVTTHVSMRNAAELIKTDRVLKVIRLAAESCSMLGIEKPRIAVAGFNPHSSENGLFGSEEADEIIPAIESARAEGLDVDGPVPPDTVFVKAVGGRYDIVVAMYHDQGHIPLKLIGFKPDETGALKQMSGINATIGLPIIRTSVDHGTAFDIAGRGIAHEGSMLEAIDMAAVMADKRFAT